VTAGRGGAAGYHAPVNATNERRRAAASRGALGRDGNNVRGEATREVILLTAERLFAERGIEAVPLRDIGVAAGQRNHVAVQYHFGDRETLVQAIAAYRAQFLTDVSANLVADLVAGGRTLTVTDFVRATVTALAANLDDESHFLPFISRYIIERGGYGGLEHTVPTGSAATLRSILQRLLPDHTEALLDERWEILFTSAVHTLARYQVMMHNRALPAPIDDLIEDLVRVLAAGLETPAATSSVDASRGRGVGVVAPQ
jgi:AcrR family transcriptional regulator